MSLLIYKIACILSGVVFSYLGYRLFVLGIFSSAGDVDVQFNDNRLILKKAAPGTFFALLGAIVIVATIIQGMNLSSSEKTETTRHEVALTDTDRNNAAADTRQKAPELTAETPKPLTITPGTVPFNSQPACNFSPQDGSDCDFTDVLRTSTIITNEVKGRFTQDEFQNLLQDHDRSFEAKLNLDQAH